MTNAIMSITLDFPFPAVGIDAPRRSTIQVPAATIRDLVELHILKIDANLRKYFYSETGEWSPVLSVFVNKRNILDLQGEKTSLKSGDMVIVLFPYAGG
ncbi:MAG: MoaD/ThiS family protein [Theionarchaea archaeon]|nr:MoaD/ThiS family protein [Theionarchaea archaeon]MBU7001416.1 MoaD/ThiS family protein [Theionarchaea archaeon]MBU7021877.1 MoaD/ThiS family protein [Theionarchaea archaeon]MBU7034329.1 MoaD/ThiS family protein [Theionarchaea archaeon]MBU7040294.1 MoaD/ThiS family protein [Theionarchaea archaeon]